MFHPRVVHASTGVGFSSRSSKSSSTPSTCSDGLPDRQDIAGRIHVPIVVRSALETGPSAHAKRQRGQQMPTDRTGFTTRKEAVDLHDRLSFRFDQPDGGPDRGVREGTGQAVVLNQATEMEIFDIDRIEPTGQHRTEFMQAIASGIGNLFMQPRHTAGLRETTVRPLLLSGQPALGTRQQGCAVEEMLGIGNRFAGREGRQATEAKIDADRLAGLDPFDSRNLDDHRHIVPTRRVTRDRHRTRIGRHGATDLQRQDSELGKRQALGRTAEPKRAAGIFGAVPDPALLLEGGVGAALGKEIHEGGLQMPQGLLERDTRDFVEEGQLRIFLECGQLRASAHKRQSFPTLEGHGSGRQHAVVDQAATAKGPGQVFGLHGSRIGAKGPTAFHSSIINHLASEVKSSRTARFLPVLNDGVSARGTR